MFRHVIVVSTLLLFSPFAAAHEGHGHPEHTDGFLHYVVNPSHSVTLLSAISVAVAAFFAVRALVRTHFRR